MSVRVVSRSALPTRFFRPRTAAPLPPTVPSSHQLAPPAWQPLQGFAAVRELALVHESLAHDAFPFGVVKGQGQGPGRTLDRAAWEDVPDPSRGEGKPPDERTLKLGKTVSILHDRLPTLLASPLPQEILSPSIALHLFPSTHPHLPTVTGRLSYTAALWTAPVAWGRVPVLGNVRLCVLSARMFNLGPTPLTYQTTTPSEKLIVRWKTCGRDAERHGVLDSLRSSNRTASAARAGDAQAAAEEDEFTGLFIFEFDAEGRISKHTIEHAQQGGNWEKMTRVVSVTDWLLGLAKRRSLSGEEGLALGFAQVHEVAEEDEGRRRLYVRRR